MKIINIMYIEAGKWSNDYLSLSIQDGSDIDIDMNIIIDEIAERLKEDQGWKKSTGEFYYLIDDEFDFYWNPDDTINVRIVDLLGFAYHVTFSLNKLISKVL
jgi:hypothetical protein